MIKFPSYITARNVHELFPLLCAINTRRNVEAVEIDAGSIQFVDPFGLCLLAACCDKLKQQNSRLKIVNLAPNVRSYWERMDFFRQCSHEEPVNHRNDLSSSLLEIQCLQDRDSIDQVARSLSKVISGKLPEYSENSEPDEMTGYLPHEVVEDNLCYMFNELLENALTHGRLYGYGDSKVWVACQYYLKTDVIKVGIIDTGCGFLQTLQDRPEKPLSDLEAIHLALQPRISCNRDVGVMPDSINQGIGLTVVHDMLQKAGGLLILMSGNAVVEISNNHSKRLLDTLNWQGTGISFEVKRGELKEQLVRDVVQQLRTTQPTPNTQPFIEFV